MAIDRAVDSAVLDAKFTAIADAIREKTGSTETMTEDEMPEQVNAVFEAGEKSEYDAFWDAYQSNGERTDYRTGFSGIGWTDTVFSPKYPITVSNGYMLFRQTNITDLTKPGVVLDMSVAADVSYAFAYSAISRLPTIDLSSATSTTNALVDYKGTDLSLVLSKTTPFTTMLSGCVNLKNLTIAGVLGTNNPRFDYSVVLTHDSLLSVLNALADYSADTSGTVWTVTLGETNLAKLSEEEIGIAEAKGWVLA